MENTLVISTQEKKFAGVWGTEDAAEMFPNMIIDPGLSPHAAEKIIRNKKPEVTVIYDTGKVLRHLASKNHKLKTKMALYTHKTFQLKGPRLVRKVKISEANNLDMIMCYSYDVVDRYKDTKLSNKIRFIPLYPGQGIFNLDESRDGGYIFAGGYSGRDYESLFIAIDGTGIPLKVAVNKPGLIKKYPKECELHVGIPVSDFINMASGSTFVVLPLDSGRNSFGLTSLVQSIKLGKAVVTTNRRSIDWYVDHGKTGFRVNPHDIDQYRKFIKILWSNNGKLSELSKGANAKMKSLEAKVILKQIRGEISKI